MLGGDELSAWYSTSSVSVGEFVDRDQAQEETRFAWLRVDGVRAPGGREKVWAVAAIHRRELPIRPSGDICTDDRDVTDAAGELLQDVQGVAQVR